MVGTVFDPDSRLCGGGVDLAGGEETRFNANISVSAGILGRIFAIWG